MNDSLLNWRGARARGYVLGLIAACSMPRLVLAQSAPDATPSPAAAPRASGPSAAEPQPEAEAEGAEADEAAAAEAEMAAEEQASLAKSQKPAPKGKGVVWGTVTDTKFNEAIVEAQISVQGTKQKSLADVDGRYRLELPPGKYQLRVSYELHRPSRVEVVVKAGELTRVDFQLVPDEGAVDEVVIEEEADHSSSEGQALERKRSTVVGDGVGRAEIAHTPDRNAAEAAQRVVGATIVDGKFVYVRGLGERYTNALLNGSPLPSTEPDRNTVPLDLFPALVLDSLSITKQFLPDMPADFAGGSVRITTRDFPRQPLFQLSLTGAYNTATTGQKRPGYQGSSTDWLGFDGGRRSFPSGIPNRRLDSTASDQDRVAYGHRFNTPLITFKKGTPPNFGMSLVAGNSYKIGKDTKLGVVAALSYGRSYQLTDITQRIFISDRLPDNTPIVRAQQEYSGQRAVDSVRWGLFGSAALEAERRHKVSLVVLRSQSADDSTYELESPGTTAVHATHLEYVSRNLNFLQLHGEHNYPAHSNLEIDWQASYAVANRDQPDTRDVRYQRGERDGVPGWNLVPDGSGQHQFIKQSDNTGTAGVDITQPLIQSEAHETKLKVGTLISSRRRDFRTRRLQLVPGQDTGSLFNQLNFCPGVTYSGGCPNYIFRPELVRSDGLLLNEFTQGLDQYRTGLDVYAAYAMLDVKVLSKLRVIGGARVEITFQEFNAFDPFDRFAHDQARSVNYTTDWLPALSAVYEVTPKANARFGVSQTLARPQLRELSPALSPSSAGDYSVQGNPFLSTTKITNVDLRFEYFPTLREVLAVSLFYKHFRDPIEEIVAGPALLNFNNAEKANLYGLELEGRKSLDSLAAALKDFTLIANLTLVESKVKLGNRKGAATTDNRALANQAPYVINLALDYSNLLEGFDARVLYNIFGPRITTLGAFGLPDIYENPRHSLDVSAAKKIGKQFELKLQVLNVLNSAVIFGYRNQQGYRQVGDGTRYESLGRQPETKRYNLGTTFAATATYSY